MDVVRRHAERLATEQGWNEMDARRLELVVTELGTNLLRHAKEGQLLLASRPESGEVEVIALDRGPGLQDAGECFDEASSNGDTSGTGLRAVRRVSEQFELRSTVPGGTVVVARLRRGGAIEPGVDQSVLLGGISVPAPGETECGDAWAAFIEGDRVALTVADGLGPGPDASVAARAALDVFREQPLGDLRDGLLRAHARLRTTRGAAICSLHLHAQGGSVFGVGAGNVVARVVSGVSDRTMLLQHGTVGAAIWKPQEASLEWPPYAIVAAHTDGIETRWSTRGLLPVLKRDPVLAAALLYRDHCRGRDDATFVIVRRRS